MTEHTPRPWEYSENTRELSHKTAVLAMIYQADDFPFYDGAEDLTEEYRANARLIAAAPDLLEACEATEAIGKHYLGPCEYCRKGMLCSEFEELRTEAGFLRQAVIAKARGEQP